MAGSYPDVPVNRMLLDRDGASLYTITGAGSVRTMLSPDQVRVLANEASDDLGLTSDVQFYLLAFPEKRDVGALYLGFAQANPDDWVDVAVQGSRDTVTGLDGTWFEVYALSRLQDGTTKGWWGHTAAGDYRRYIRAIPPVTGLRALRIVMVPTIPDVTAWRLTSVHCFGVPAYEANPHRLEVWHPWLDHRVPGAHFDWGNVPDSSSADKSFRVRNVSFERSAADITVSVDALTDASPPFVPQLLLSYDGSGFAGTAAISRLGPGATSRVLTVRRVTPSDAVGGAWAQRVLATAATWTEPA